MQRISAPERYYMYQYYTEVYNTSFTIFIKTTEEKAQQPVSQSVSYSIKIFSLTTV